MNIIERLWKAQVAYNVRIRAKEEPTNYEYWMKQYLLGAISEVNEILDEINWKIHKRGRALNKMNLARELADLTKYVLCMWEWSGFTYKDMLMYCLEKTAELDIQYHQDFESELRDGAPVVITDIDGTLGDYRLAFYQWLQENHPQELPPDEAHNLAMEIDLRIPYLTYVRYKEQFESTGGYRRLSIYPEVKTTIEELWDRGAHILAYTARPANTHSRIWDDTSRWVSSVGLAKFIQEIRIGQETRIARACELIQAGHPVVMLEDDPSTAIRAAEAGVWVCLRNQPYNVGIYHSRIVRLQQLDVSTIWYMINTVEATHGI